MRELLGSFALVAALLAMAACSGTPPSRFYVLTSLEDGPPRQGGVQDLRVRVGPVELPHYLSTPEIVTRRGNQLELASFDRWGSPLDNQFKLILARNLAILLPSDRVARFLWEETSELDHHLTVSASRFEVEGDQAVLTARWMITGPDIGDPQTVRRMAFTKTVEGKSYEAKVAAMSDVMAQMCRAIAEDIRAAGTP